MSFTREADRGHPQQLKRTAGQQEAVAELHAALDYAASILSSRGGQARRARRR
jgi:hypothetical protein